MCGLTGFEVFYPPRLPSPSPSPLQSCSLRKNYLLRRQLTAASVLNGPHTSFGGGGGGRTGTDPPASSPDRTAKYFRKYRYLTMYVPGIQRFMEDPKTEELKLPIFGGFCFRLKNFENIELGAVFQWGVGNIFRFRSFNIFGFKLKSTITVEIKIVKIGT